MSNNQKSLNLQSSIPSVEEYTFDPIKGYPMLHWKGKRPFTSTQYYPAQLKEVHGEETNGWINKIFWGDNLQVMSHLLKKFRGQVDLVYIDPPFDSKADYKKKVSLKGKSIGNDHNAFEEKQYTDIWTNDDYLQYVYERIILIRELLSENGTIYIHCDWHKSHYLRIILDEIFGKDNFINEIIWKRANTVKGNVGQGSKFWGANTDTIFFYKKTEQYTFNSQYSDYSKDYIDKFYKHTEEKTGRRYQLISMTAPGGASKGNPFYEVMGIKRFWRYSQEKMQKLIDQGLVVQTKPGNVPRKKIYLDEGEGVPVQSLWDDLPALSSQSDERIGYPTQKPVVLLERIIKASSNPGDLIFDCFMGSGTTQAVAMKLGRRFIGADINLGAIQTTTKRLINVAAEIKEKQEKEASQLDLKVEDQNEEESISNYYTGFEVYNVNHYDVFRNPVEARDILMKALEIQPLPNNTIYDGEKDGRMVKIMPVNRIATRADLNPLITGFDYKTYERRHNEAPGRPVEQILLVCMGHEPDLAATLQKEVKFKLDIEVVDVLRDQSRLEFKRESEAEIKVENRELVIEQFYPMNLLQKLSLMKENVEDWRELTESVMIDWNYDGAVFEPKVVDVPGKDELVEGSYPVPDNAGTIRVKITDLLSESLEVEIN